MSKPIRVEQYTKSGEFVAAYPSINEAARKTKIKNASIRGSLFNQQFAAGDYIWAHNKDDVQVKFIIQKHLEITDSKDRHTFVLDTIYELKVLQERLKNRPATKIKARLLNDGRIKVKLDKTYARKRRLPAEEEDQSHKTKWWICYQVNGLDYRYALDFGRGDSPEEAIEDFKKSRFLSELKHKVIYIDKDYYKVFGYLLRNGGQQEARVTV